VDNYFRQNNQDPQNGYHNPQNLNQTQEESNNFRHIYNKMDRPVSGGIKKKRLAAAVIDALFLSAAAFLLFYVFILSKRSDILAVYEIGGSSAIVKEWLGSFIAVILLYITVFMINQIFLPLYIFHGQSIGKKIMKIRMVNAEDESKAVDVTTLLLREVIGKQISSILMIGWIMFLVSKDGLTLHDKIFKTNVVDDEY